MPHSGSVIAFAPGRVNLLGEHTDYNGGLALPFAIARGVTVRVTALPGPLVMVRAADYRETDTFDLWRPGHAEGWRAFVRGTIAELTAAGHPLRAARVEIRGTLPRGAGLGSSAALTCGLALALLALAGVEDPDRRELARLCSRVEQHWAGARTGLLDQYATLLSRPGHALRIDFAQDHVEPVPLELGDWRLAVVSAGRRENASSGYADRRRECEAGDPRRMRHVATENERVEAAVAALRRGDVAALGPLLDASHASLRDDFEASTDAVEQVVARCKSLGAAGARLIGGGFGGHVLALMPPGRALPRGIEVAPSAAAVARSD